MIQEVAMLEESPSPVSAANLMFVWITSFLRVINESFVICLKISYSKFFFLSTSFFFVHQNSIDEAESKNNSIIKDEIFNTLIAVSLIIMSFLQRRYSAIGGENLTHFLCNQTSNQ